ncbi:MAG TPA: lipoprotein [Candidatus Aquabacterium excrementipullorum]|nr:lipoprotein [Candidatus Aquabacterium excrementipullorum]
MLLSTLAACGQKGPLYMPDHPPASHRHGAAPKAAAAPSAASTASTPTSNSSTQP